MPKDDKTGPSGKLARIQKLKEQQAQIAAKLRDLEARAAAQARKDDTRRKIIAGSLALEHMEKNPDTEFSRKLFTLIDEYARPIERRLFAHLGIGPAPAEDAVSEKGPLRRDFPG